MKLLPTLAALSLLAPLTLAVGETTPNILVILVDDCGPEQLECYDATPTSSLLAPGSNLYDLASNDYDYAPTPNITKLAERGVRFTRAFSSPTCSPTRAQLNTGLYPHRTGIGTIVTPSGLTAKRPFKTQQLDLSPTEVILSEALTFTTSPPAAPAYSSAWFGKWHLTREPNGREGVPPSEGDPLGDDHPVLVGWPTYEGIIRNPLEFPRPSTAHYTGWFQVDSVATSSDPFVSSTRTTVDGPYITTYQREDLEAWITAQSSSWCAVWAATACHSPYNEPPTSLQSYGTLANSVPAWTRFRAALEALDTELGILEANLGASVWDNTVVILAGDNGTDKHTIKAAVGAGATTLAPYATSLPVKRFKGSAYMTGSNIPLIVAGPGVVSPGRTNDDLVDMVDVYDSIMELAGRTGSWETATGTTDGISFVPALTSAAGTNGRIESLALTYRPNGPMSARDGFRVGYTRKVGSKVYRLIRNKEAGFAVQPDEFYLISDGGVDVDPLEASPLPNSGADYTTVASALITLCPDCD